MHDVEAAGAEAEVESSDVDDDLVTLAHLAEQRFVGPSPAALAIDLDRQRLRADYDAATQLQPPAHPAAVSAAASATMPSQTASIASRSAAATHSFAV